MANIGKEDVNILFTGVGRRVELVRAFRKAYDTLGIGGNIVATDIDPLAPALQIVDVPYLVPRLDSPDYIPQIVKICRREAVQLIFPLIDPDIPVLAQHRAAIGATGAHLAVVSAEAAQIAGDKWITYQFFKHLGIPTPISWLPGHPDLMHAEYPLFIKPRYGSAAKHVFQVRNDRELDFFSEYIPSPIIQQCLTGPEITNDAICDIEGEVLAVVSRQRIEVRWGEVAKGVTIHDPLIAEYCIGIARALPAIGPVTIQCMMHDGLPYFTEINARLGGGVTLGIAAGANSPLWLLARAANIPVEVPSPVSYQTGLYLSRFDDSVFLSEADYEQISSHHL